MKSFSAAGTVIVAMLLSPVSKLPSLLSPDWINQMLQLPELWTSITLQHILHLRLLLFWFGRFTKRPTAYRSHKVSDAEHFLHVPIACDGFFTLGLWLNVSIHFWLSSPTVLAKHRSERIVSLALSRSWRISHAAGTAHHPTIRNNVLDVSVFSCQDSKRFSLSHIHWEKNIKTVFLNYNEKINSLQISKSYVHSKKSVIQ